MLTSWLQGIILEMAPVQYGVLVACFALGLMGLSAFCFRRLRYLRLIEDTPTARVRSAAQGFVELDGKVEFPRTPALTSPLRGLPCVWWSYRIEDLDPAGESEPAPWDFVVALGSTVLQFFGARGSGRLVEAASSHECFLIRDETGACVVDPDQAHMIGLKPRVWIEGTKRFEESVIRVDQRLYAVGLFRTAHDHDEASERREIGELISTWKMNRIKLAEMFDANRDGKIDDAEWSLAWQAATAEVRQRRASREPAPDLHVLCKPADHRPYLISALSERTLTSRFWFQSIMGVMTGTMVAVALAWLLGVRSVL